MGGEKEGPLVTISVANPTSTHDYVQNFNFTCDWPFVKIYQAGLGNKHSVSGNKHADSMFISQTGLT
jgi:hypothetical protein